MRAYLYTYTHSTAHTDRSTDKDKYLIQSAGEVSVNASKRTRVRDDVIIVSSILSVFYSFLCEQFNIVCL